MDYRFLMSFENYNEKTLFFKPYTGMNTGYRWILI